MTAGRDPSGIYDAVRLMALWPVVTKKTVCVEMMMAFITGCCMENRC
jgi:hypothetical protein